LIFRYVIIILYLFNKNKIILNFDVIIVYVMKNYKYIERNNLIVFKDDFNEQLDNYIDMINKYDTILFGKSFNNDISILPPNITTILFHSESDFNHEIKYFPYNLRKIVFGKIFSKPLDYLPLSFEVLEFVPLSEFNCDLYNLPPSVKKITLGTNFSKSINCLPSNLEYLKISSLYYEEIKVLPNKLKHLIFYNDDFEKNYHFNPISDSKNNNYEFEIKKLPPNLIKIKYPPNYSFPITELPKSLKILKINNSYEFKKDIKKNFHDIKIYYM